MKNLCLIVLVTIATMLVGLNGATNALGGPAYVSVPGNSLVQDWEEDFLIEVCDVSSPDSPCSLPPNQPPVYPGWLDILKAKITQLGGERVNLSIKLQEPIPVAPSIPFLMYYWQFQDGCVVPSPTNSDAIIVWWNGNTETWSAKWVLITGCNPRTYELGASVNFMFTEDGLKVQVPLNDLIIDPETPLKWFTGVRLMSFAHPLFTQTNAVDVAPNVYEYDHSTSPPTIFNPEDPAEWEMR